MDVSGAKRVCVLSGDGCCDDQKMVVSHCQSSEIVKVCGVTNQAVPRLSSKFERIGHHQDIWIVDAGVSSSIIDSSSLIGLGVHVRDKIHLVMVSV